MEINAEANGPIVITTQENINITLCRCGLTKDSPYCDDSHKALRRGMASFSLKDKQLNHWIDLSLSNLELIDNDEGDQFLSGCCGGHCQCHQ